MSPVAVVTGAARGIGAATVDALVADGWHVVAVDRCADDPALSYALATPSDLQAVAERHGDAVRTLVGDVRTPSDMRAAVEEAVRHFGGLHAAVAVAGVVSGGPPLWEMPDAQWDVQFDVNVNGVRRLAAAAVPVLLDQPPPRQGRAPRGRELDRRPLRYRLADTGVELRQVELQLVDLPRLHVRRERPDHRRALGRV